MDNMANLCIRIFHFPLNQSELSDALIVILRKRRK